MMKNEEKARLYAAGFCCWQKNHVVAEGHLHSLLALQVLSTAKANDIKKMHSKFSFVFTFCDAQ